jgi:DNA-binding transcriptional ArsR family regulator
MADQPELATIASVIGERTRATMLMGLMDGRSLTATELARGAKVSKQTASSHLSKLVDARLLAVESAGRHRYFRLASDDVAAVIESLMALAYGAGVPRIYTGPVDPPLRLARVCYDHLAGDLGVMAFDSLVQRGFLRVTTKGVTLTADGERFFQELGVDIAKLESGRRPLCLACLDWSARRPHLAGALGAAMLSRLFALGWARRQRGTRVVVFPATGERSFRARFI